MGYLYLTKITYLIERMGYLYLQEMESVKVKVKGWQTSYMLDP